MVDFLASKLAKIFRSVITADGFPSLWRTANITTILNGRSPSQFHLNFRPVSITPIISKVYEKLISRRLYKFVDSIKVLSNTQFGY